MRFIVDLHRTDEGGVEGAVTADEPGEPRYFTGWLELLRMLEGVEVSSSLRRHEGIEDQPEPFRPQAPETG